MESRKRILVVEDRPEYRKAAETYFGSRKDIQVAYAIDFDEAIRQLLVGYEWDFDKFSRQSTDVFYFDEGFRQVPGESRQDGVIIDCFFPEKTGSNDRELGRSVIQRIEDKCFPVITDLKPYIDLGNRELRAKIRGWLFWETFSRVQKGNTEEFGPPDIELFSYLQKLSIEKGREEATKRVMEKNYIPDWYGDRDHYLDLEKALEESENNQPLGILIAERATALGIPFVGTSIDLHDFFSDQINLYIRKKKGLSVDLEEDEKATPEFWGRAFNELVKTK